MTEPTSAQDLFKGRHYGRARHLVGSYDDLAVGAALRPDFEKRWQAYARPVGDSWRVDETYIKVKGQWVYLHWVVDKEGCTVDFLLSRRRDMAAARRFFSRETKQRGAPRVM